VSKECVSHHHACDCREERTKKLVQGLMDLAIEWRQKDCSFTNPMAEYKRLHLEARELGYERK